MGLIWLYKLIESKLDDELSKLEKSVTPKADNGQKD